jgi:hypothetical protein
MYAFVEDGVITYRGPLPRNWRNVSGLDMADANTLLSLGWRTYVEVSPPISTGECYDGETLEITADTVTSTKVVRSKTAEELAADTASRLWFLADYRYEKEVGGVTVSSVPVNTDRETQSKLIAVRILAKEDVNYSVDWKGTDGFVTLNAATIIAIADAVATYVQACFSREKVLSAAINAAQDPASVDITTGWPNGRIEQNTPGA